MHSMQLPDHADAGHTTDPLPPSKKQENMQHHDGTPALGIPAASTALSTVLAMAPTLLKHRSENRVPFHTVAVAAAAFMHRTLAWLAHRGLARLQLSGN